MCVCVYLCIIIRIEKKKIGQPRCRGTKHVQLFTRLSNSSHEFKEKIVILAQIVIFEFIDSYSYDLHNKRE